MIQRLKASFDSLDKRSRRAVCFGAIAVVMIVFYLYAGLPLITDWSQVRDRLKVYQDKQNSIDGSRPGSEAKNVGLFQAVPFLELPEKEDVQRKLFWDKTYDQLKSAGIQMTFGPAYISSTQKKKGLEYKTLRLKFKGTCKYDQLVKFLGNLNENPYFVSLEEFTMKDDEKKPGQINVEMVMETFIN